MSWDTGEIALSMARAVVVLAEPEISCWAKAGGMPRASGVTSAAEGRTRERTFMRPPFIRGCVGADSKPRRRLYSHSVSGANGRRLLEWKGWQAMLARFPCL